MEDRSRVDPSATSSSEGVDGLAPIELLRYQREERRALQQALADQAEHLDALIGQVAHLEARESELRRQVADAHAQLIGRDRLIQSLRVGHAEAEMQQLAEVRTWRVEADAQRQAAAHFREVLDEVAEQANQLRGQVADLESRLAAGDRQLAELNQLEAEHGPRVAELQQRVEERDRLIADLRQQQRVLQDKVDFMASTRAWRLGERFVRIRERLASWLKTSPG